MLAYPGSPADEPVPFPDVPGVAKQTPWPCGIYDFGTGKPANCDFFNCTMVRRRDGLWLIVRRARNVPGMRFGMNDLVAFKLENNYPVNGYPIRLERRFADEQFEDPRAVNVDGRVFVSCCDFVWTSSGWSGAHQIMCEVASDWSAKSRVDPEYGNNGPNIGKNTGHEKNWLWFWHDGNPHLLYSGSPHVVVRFNEDFTKDQEFYTECDNLPWKLGQLRGGTPPVLIGEEYWTFFHSSTQWQKPRRRYHMGAYTFESKPPFRMLRVVDGAILSGSRFDPVRDPKPLVVFPGGCDFADGKFHVVFGVNDHLCGWIQIPYEDLEKRMVPVARKQNAIKAITDSVVKAVFRRRPKLDNVTLVCVDDRRPDLAELAVEKCVEQCEFKDVKFLTSDTRNRNAIAIPPVRSYEDYSRFMVKELDKYVTTSHCLVVQWDGYVVNGDSWRDDWLQYDYIGSPWKGHMEVGNGGFSLRSKRLLTALQHKTFRGPYMPEDQYICKDKREHLDHMFKLKFAAAGVALQFSIENGLHDRQFGFHSFLTRFVKPNAAMPKVFHHSGDLGDIIYALPSIKASGGGVLFLSPDNDTPNLPNWPPRQRMCEAVANNLDGLLTQQQYIWKPQYTGYYPDAAMVNFNNFRKQYTGNMYRGNATRESLLQMQAKAAGVNVDETKPWLTVDLPMIVHGRPIVVNRTGRYRNLNFPWGQIVKQHGHRMIFVGTEDEHSDFIAEFGFVPRIVTNTLLDAARLLAGCKLFIGNQSALMAIALGLGCQLVQEVWEQDPNCILKRDNATYHRGGPLKLQANWL